MAKKEGDKRGAQNFQNFCRFPLAPQEWMKLKQQVMKTLRFAITT